MLKHSRNVRKRLSIPARRAVVFISGLGLLAACVDGSNESDTGLAQTADSVEIESISLTAEDFTEAENPDEVFELLEQLRPVAEAGEGKIAVLLPDTQSSARYVEQDTPAFERAFEVMGLQDDYVIHNAQANSQRQATQAEQAITDGASVLLLDNLDSGSGAAIQANADAQGVPTIDYDRLTVNGSATHYVSFDNEYVGTLLAEGVVECIEEWGIEKPELFVLAGAPTDNNATLSQVGIDDVVDPLEDAGDLNIVGKVRVDDWDNQVGQTMFEQALTANPEMNAVVSGNDGLAQAAISILKNQGVDPKKFPTTGQDATTQGLQNILAGYQCMTVYKPVHAEAAAAAALAVFLRAGMEPPEGLVNGEYDAESHKVPSLLVKPISVNASNMKDTVFRDGFADPDDICVDDLVEICEENGILK